jgi:hypothetical protein
MERRTKLRAYGLNLLGSLLGVLAFISGLTFPKKDIEELPGAPSTIGHETVY